MRALIIGLALFGLAACGQADKVATTETAAVDARGPVAEESQAMGGASGEGNLVYDLAATTPAPPAAPPPPPGEPAPAQQPGPQQPSGPNPIAYLAYSYQIGVEVPAAGLTPLMEAHTRACVSAGPRLCQLIGSQRQGDPEAYISGSLSIRAEPNWLRSFMGRLDNETQEAGGRVRSRSTQTEDLTRAIVDTEASLRAKRTLRDRLQRLLASRPGRLSDLLEVEREFARVQSEIDATESNLAVMRTRVDMSALTITYESQPRSVASNTFEPLRDALAGFLRIVVQGIAIIITLIAGLLPFAILAWGIVWLLLVIRRRRGGRFFRRDAPPPPAAPPS